MKLLDICRKAGIECPEHLSDIDVKGITSRSNEVKKDYAFVCLEGTKTDGHSFAEDAIVRGASVVVIEKEEYKSDKALLVEDTRAALSLMMNAFCGSPTEKMQFIAVTGTNGKTSVSAMIKNIFDKVNISCELIGTLNCSSFSPNVLGSQMNLTTPDPEELYPMLQRMSAAGIRIVVMEASSHALSLKKLEPITFEIAIFTNLTEDHLDFHKTMEDYFSAKLELFKRCRKGIINIDDEYGKRLTKIVPCDIKTCSIEKLADYFADNVDSLDEKGSKYELVSKKTSFDMLCRIPGRFSVMNSMQAAACALEYGIDANYIRDAFDSFFGVLGRLQRVDFFEELGIVVYIDYAHTPDALLKLLQTARPICKREGRLTVLFGCGGDREKEKRKIMGMIAVDNADRVIVTSDNPRSENPLDIINDIVSGIKEQKNFVVIPDRRKAIRYAIATAKKDDVLILAGKGHENYEINARGKIAFDEVEILRDIKNTMRRNEE